MYDVDVLLSLEYPASILLHSAWTAILENEWIGKFSTIYISLNVHEKLRRLVIGKGMVEGAVLVRQ